MSQAFVQPARLRRTFVWTLLAELGSLASLLSLEATLRITSFPSQRFVVPPLHSQNLRVVKGVARQPQPPDPFRLPLISPVKHPCPALEDAVSSFLGLGSRLLRCKERWGSVILGTPNQYREQAGGTVGDDVHAKPLPNY